MGRRNVLSVGLIAVLAAGPGGACGGGEEQGTPETAPRIEPLSAQQKRQVDRAEEAIATYCRRFARSVARGRATPPVAVQRPAFVAADELIALARQSPQGVVRRGVDMRTLLGDVAENLEGSNCDQRLVQHLDRGLALLPLPRP